MYHPYFASQQQIVRGWRWLRCVRFLRGIHAHAHADCVHREHGGDGWFANMPERVQAQDVHGHTGMQCDKPAHCALACACHAASTLRPPTPSPHTWQRGALLAHHAMHRFHLWSHPEATVPRSQAACSRPQHRILSLSLSLSLSKTRTHTHTHARTPPPPPPHTPTHTPTAARTCTHAGARTSCLTSAGSEEDMPILERGHHRRPRCVRPDTRGYHYPRRPCASAKGPERLREDWGGVGGGVGWGKGGAEKRVAKAQYYIRE